MNPVDRTSIADSDPSPDFPLSNSNTDRGDVDDGLFKAKNLCEDNCKKISYMEQLFDRTFHNCQLCDKR